MNHKRKIGIMGGTFDPIHIGHLILAETAKAMYNLDVVYVMPNGNPKYKSHRNVTDAKIRMEMVNLAIEDNSNLAISDMEVRRDGYTYTYETLQLLKQENPDDEIYFILGADSLFSIDSWKCPELIAPNCIILIANRDRVEEHRLHTQTLYLKEKYGMHIDFLDCPCLDISSQMLREMVAKGRSIRYYVPEKVRQYIIEKGLYIP